MDSLPSVLKKRIPDSRDVTETACGQTKSTSLVKGVLGKAGKEEPDNMLKRNHFSIIVDETTDRTVKTTVYQRFYETTHRELDNMYNII